METTLSWLSDDIVRFKIEMGVVNFSAQKYASHATAVVIDDVYCAST